MAADIKRKFGTQQSFTCTLASLANGSARQSAEIDNTADLFLDALLLLVIKTGASGVSSTGTVEIYVYGQVQDGTPERTDGAGATDAAITVKNAVLVHVMSCTANATTYRSGPVAIASAFGGVLPAKWGVIVRNNTGAALDGTEGNHKKLWQGVLAQSV